MNPQEAKPYFLEGMALPETPEEGKEPKPWDKVQVVGKPIPRVDAYQRVSGTAVFPSDVILPDMLYGAVLSSPHAHARVKSVDISEAEKMPGVRAVICGLTRGCDIKWNYRGKGDTKLFPSVCRYEGDAVAAVAADTPYQAWDALKFVKVEYEVRSFVSDERSALDQNAPKVHETGNLVAKPEVYARGDVSRGFAEADVVLETSFRTECELHAPIELHGCVARWDGDMLTLWHSTQGVYAIQAEIAKTLGLPLAKVRVIGNYMGGGFGSKLQIGKGDAIAALLARMTGRPVKLFISREQTLLDAGNRPPNDMTLKAGVKKDGSLTALQFTCLGTGGAYPAGGTSLVDFLIKDHYLCPNVECTSTDVYINAGPARPFRAPGHPQASWALEQMLDQLAAAINMDPVDLRLKNIPSFSQGRPGNPPYTTSGFKECLEKGAEAFGWRAKRDKLKQAPQTGHIKTGIGMAGSMWFVGGGWPPSTVVIKLFGDGSANLNMGASDLGTGTKTVMAMIVAEELGLRPDAIQIEHADTGTTQFTPPSGGSKTVPSDGPAVREAAVKVKQQLVKIAAKELATEPADLVMEGGWVRSAKDPSKKKRISDLEELKKRGVIVGVGYKQPNPENKVINPFGAQFCEVQVDTNTGEVRVLRFVAAHDSGRVMNRLTYDGQVMGGVVMGVGFGMTEGRVLDHRQTGKLCNKNLHDYKVPGALDVPAEIVTVPINTPDDQANSIGAKGLGEPVTVPTAAAIANAVYNATGVRVTTTPVNAIQLSRLIAQNATSKKND